MCLFLTVSRLHLKWVKRTLIFSIACVKKKKKTIYTHRGGLCDVTSVSVRKNLRFFTKHVTNESRMGVRY